MKTILFILAVIILSSCGAETANEFQLSRLKKPVIVIAKSEQDSTHYGSIILKGSDGSMITFSGLTYTGVALVRSYSKGDTIK